MKKALLLALLCLFTFAGTAIADGPSGSTECHLKDDDCDNAIDEDTGAASDDADGDGAIDEDDVGDTNGDGNPDDDLDGAVDEDVSDDDSDGAIDEDAPGDATDEGENQVDCGDGGTDVAGVGNVYAGTNGAEVCADDSSSAPIDGRATVDTEEGYVAIDGDNSNTQGPSNGYARVDEDGVHCGDESNQDAGADQSSNKQDDCG
jgi:hypothetical protein